MESHLKAGLKGKDLNKPDPVQEETSSKEKKNQKDQKDKKDADKSTGKQEPPKIVFIPETMGLESNALFIFAVLLIIPFFCSSNEIYPAMMFIVLTTLLGLADDILNIPWRIKFFIPLFTVLPLVLNYSGSTTICLHGFLAPIRSLLKLQFSCIDIGIFYLVYMILLSIFCTHAINIYAGINGLEAGQSFIIACFLLFHCLYYWDSQPGSQAAVIILLPFIAATYGLLHFNWYPSKVFVGDTFTLTAGAVISAAGILGHFPEMTLLFMLPQVVNFVISLPLLLGIWKCPRHRLPTLNQKTGKLEGDASKMNIVNLWLCAFGPKTEERECIELMILQFVCCSLAYVVKYFYNQALIP